jgi:regulatory protein
MTTRTRRDPHAEPIADPEAAREAALKLLERTRRTRVDLERRLKDKGYAAVTIAQVLDRLAHVGLVDDTEYARAFLAGRLGRRPSGWRRLQQQLRGKGVSEADALAARARIEEREGAIDEIATARKLIVAAARRYASLEPRVRQQRLYALLARRGYDGDVIRRALAIPDEPETGE